MNLEIGPPLSARKLWPSISKAMVITVALRHWTGVAIVGDGALLAVLEDGEIEVDRLLRVHVEPQAGGHLVVGHCSSPAVSVGTGLLSAAQALTIVLKPPKIMRLASNGIFWPCMKLAMRLSAITAFMQRLRTARDL